MPASTKFYVEMCLFLENSTRKLNQMIISNNLTLHKFNKWLEDSRDMMESILEMGHQISLFLNLIHKVHKYDNNSYQAIAFYILIVLLFI